VLSQFSEDRDKKTLAHYFSSISKDIYPVGRLDYDSEGLLLLTNDKELNHQLLDPKFKHKRTYWVQVEGEPTKEALHNLTAGVTINVNGKKHTTAPAKVSAFSDPPILPERNPPIRFRKNIPTSWISLTLTEGKNRQVRKMTAAIGYPTLRLVRYSISKINIEGLEPGSYRELDHSEKELLLIK
jgi:23S rRNA pseudouridine2457 synthase